MKRLGPACLGFLLLGLPAWSQTDTPTPNPEQPGAEAALESLKAENVQREERKKEDPAIGLSIAEAIRMALVHNLDVAIQQIDTSIRATDIAIAEAELDPTLRANVRYGERSEARSSAERAADAVDSVESENMDAEVALTGKTAAGTEIGFLTNTSNSRTTFNNFTDEYRSFAGLTLTQPLLKNFGTGPNLAPIRIAQKGVLQAESTFRFQVENIVQRVYDASYELLFVLADLDSKREGLRLAQQLESDNKSRAELGVMTPLDVSQARSEVALRLNDIAQAERGIIQNQNALKRLIYRDLIEFLDYPVHLQDGLQNPSGEILVMPNIAAGLANREDYRALLYRADADDLTLAFRKNQALPQLDLNSSVGYSGIDNDVSRSYQRVFDTRDEDWFVGFTFSYPLGNEAEKNRVEASKLQKQRTLLELKSLEQDIVVQVHNALAALESTRKQVDASRAARIFAEENAKAEQEKLKEGTSTSFTVLQLQREVVNTRTQEYRALADYNKALVELKKAQGILLKESGIELAPPAALPVKAAGEAKAPVPAIQP
jgi:outer membrane protein TolC